MNETPEQTLDAVGPRLKQLRLRREVTLTQLAAETRISASTLSRLETGLRRPTLEQLLPLARYYGVTIDSLVDAPRTADPRLDLRPMSCPDGSVIIPLTRRPGGVQAYKFVRPTGRDDLVPDPRTHEGHDWVYVLNGTLRLVLGDQDLRLQAGEAAEFDTRTPHWFGATSAGRSSTSASSAGRESVHISGSTKSPDPLRGPGCRRSPERSSGRASGI